MEIKTVRTSGVAPHIPVIEELNVTDNGTYTAPTGVDGYSPVTVNVQPNLGTKNITQNGTYTASSDNLDGYSSVTVDAQEAPWAPLKDGYSNFWFKLTDDTLSPWLKFSAKNNNAVIDWGDGSGEVALDTLTPTHTYAKAGKYVVKVKGATMIAKQHNAPYTKYIKTLTAIELNSDIIGIAQQAFEYCVGLEHVYFDNSNSQVSFGNYLFNYCSNLTSVILPNNIPALPERGWYCCFSLSNIQIPSTVTQINSNVFDMCINLSKITIPSSVTQIGNYIFNMCYTLSEIHCQSTSPPSLGTNVFNGLPSDFIIYVPVGYAETYKQTSRWSTYASHIQEEV